jgi:phosphatidate cytidylyltransferase
MALRILTGVVLIILVVAAVWWGPGWLLALLAAAVAMLALVEFFRLGERVGLRAFREWTILSTAGLFFAQYTAGMVEVQSAGNLALVRRPFGFGFSIESLLLIFLFGAVACALATRRPLPEIPAAIAISSAGLLTIALPLSYLVRINEMERFGRELVLFTLAVVWAGDTLAYFVGQFLGRTPMAPVLSPKKTWEGAAANLIASLLVGFAFARWLDLDLPIMLVTAGLANIAGQAGDLVESAYKRAANVKDSGTLVPGHGGVLDRVDALILAAPAVWLVYEWFAKQ